MPVNQRKGNVEASTQTHLKIAEIKDNTIVLKDGSVRAVLSVSSVNFELLSEQEQNSIIYSYQSFLNSLDFPIQIVIRSKRLDIEGYLTRMTEIANKQSDTRLKQQTFDYIDFVASFVEYSDIMEKDFYIVVPHEPDRSKGSNFFQRFMQKLNPSDNGLEYKIRKQEFSVLRKTLNQRANSVVNALSSAGIYVKRLNTHELIQMLYEVHNPLNSQGQKVENLLQLNLFDFPKAAGQTENE
ncbi:MAG: TraC family protein [Candidatus Abawacabacteria bacterium]|nr:TraC family protein [Candidatus Abawacabacteria bacterium]